MRVRVRVRGEGGRVGGRAGLWVRQGHANASFWFVFSRRAQVRGMSSPLPLNWIKFNRFMGVWQHESGKGRR